MRVVSGGIFSCVRHNLPDDFLGLGCRVAGCAQRYIIGQPDVEIEPVLDIFGEKLLLQMGSENATKHEKYEGAKEDAPTERDRSSDESVVKAVEASLSLFFDTEFFLFRRSLHVVTQNGSQAHA